MKPKLNNKRVIKIFGFPSHQTLERTSGVDFARIIQPMKYLNGYEDENTIFNVDLYNIHDDNKKLDWGTVAKDYDIVYLNYISDAWAFAAMGCMMKKMGKKIVLDVDDALWLIREDNTAYEVYKPKSEAINNFTSMCNVVDAMTTTNSYLKNVILYNTNQKNIGVFTNTIDLDLYKYKPPFKDTNDIQITHFGSSSHFLDLQNESFVTGMDRLMKDLPNVTFKTIGAFIPKLKEKWGLRYKHDFGDVDIYKWINEKFPQFMEESDIVVAPLDVDSYNKSKSEIKYLEYSSAGKAGVYQNIRQYEEVVKPGFNGYLAGSADMWYNTLYKLATNAKHRQMIGENAYKDVQNRTIQGIVKSYAEFFKDLVPFSFSSPKEVLPF